MFVHLVNETTQTSHLAVLVEKTHEGTKGTLYVFYPEFGTARFVNSVPHVGHAYADEDGKHPFEYYVEVSGVVPNRVEGEEVNVS